MGEAYLCGSGGGSAGCVIGVTFPSTCNCICQRTDIDSKIYMAPSLSEDDLAKTEYLRYWAFSLPPHSEETEYLIKIIYLKDGTKTAQTKVKIKKKEYKRVDLALSKVIYDAVNNILPDNPILFGSTLNNSNYYQVNADFGIVNSGISINNLYHGSSYTGQFGQVVFERQINATFINETLKLKGVKTVEVTLGSYNMTYPDTSYLAIIISQPPPSSFNNMNAKSTFIIRDANIVKDEANGNLNNPKTYSIDVSSYDIPTGPSDGFYVGIASAAGIPGYDSAGNPYQQPNPTKCLLQKVELKY